MNETKNNSRSVKRPSMLRVLWVVAVGSLASTQLSADIQGHPSSVLVSFPWSIPFAIAISTLWAYHFSQWFRVMGISVAWSVPYVFGLLCPAAWFGVSHFLPGYAVGTIVLLQAPIAIAVSMRSSTK